MIRLNAALQAHLQTGYTTIARAWAVKRRDGQIFGFTDHDRVLEFDGISFRPETGLTAMALEQSTGLSVDNTEALGVLSDTAITSEDIEAGRFDGAEIRFWIVNWADVSLRDLQFRGHFGELTRAEGGFRVEIRGLAEALNRPLGRVYQKPCSAVLGDANCAKDLSIPGYFHDGVVDEVEDRRVFRFTDLTGFEDGWFTWGVIEATSGASSGLKQIIKRDYFDDGQRVIELVEPFRVGIAPGDGIRLIAGCDKRLETCRLKFDNILNFQGFPDLPGEDWIMLNPATQTGQSGGSRR